MHYKDCKTNPRILTKSRTDRFGDTAAPPPTPRQDGRHENLHHSTTQALATKKQQRNTQNQVTGLHRNVMPSSTQPRRAWGTAAETCMSPWEGKTCGRRLCNIRHMAASIAATRTPWIDRPTATGVWCDRGFEEERGGRGVTQLRTMASGWRRAGVRPKHSRVFHAPWWFFSLLCHCSLV
jgi:hypothetical protein